MCSSPTSQLIIYAIQFGKKTQKVSHRNQRFFCHFSFLWALDFLIHSELHRRRPNWIVIILSSHWLNDGAIESLKLWIRTQYKSPGSQCANAGKSKSAHTGSQGRSLSACAFSRNQSDLTSPETGVSDAIPGKLVDLRVISCFLFSCSSLYSAVVDDKPCVSKPLHMSATLVWWIFDS